ncbi:LysE/ArgO family amino acid transporter [Paenibacillus sp. 481]|uniref:LysE/ArgO family amino acid transporter n=1 Tax=Paenibacillus sp. 481 TaxID=2835869 RepID=UPI001E47374E|nr:LysE/ArgO family amino acid transporter [Paenibacillus sp. 481]UHA73818.1 amino acid transporter [Paenibacillus sp. 481]
MFEAMLHGIILAFGLILPLGVQNVFIFNQGASQPSLWRAAPAFITASLCDTLLIVMAVQGVSLVVLTVPMLKQLIFGIGILFLLYMGWIVWRSQANRVERQEALPLRRQVLFAASVSLLNPHAILDTIGVIGTSSLVYSDAQKWAFTGATVIVSWCWFAGLACAGRWVGSLHSSGRLLFALNRVSAFIIWGIALYLLMQLNPMNL